MFLGIDRQDPGALALVDNEGHRVTYGELAETVRGFSNAVPPRSVGFMLCRNTAGALAGHPGVI